MSRWRSRVPGDLALASAAAIASLVLALLPAGGLAWEVALVPLVLVLPGYALAAAMFGPGTIARAERLVYTVSLSVGAAALSGLFWQLWLGLDRLAWASLLTAVTLLACAVAQRRRLAPPRREPKRLPQLPRPNWPTALAIVAAVAIAVVAVDTAAEGLEDQRGMSHFSSLWIVPDADQGGSLEVGVWNHLGAAHDYRILVDRGGIVLRDRRLRLGPHQQLQMTLAAPELIGSEIPSKELVVVTLYKDGVPYRRTEFDAGVGT
jgi:hypothetical protein